MRGLRLLQSKSRRWCADLLIQTIVMDLYELYIRWQVECIACQEPCSHMLLRKRSRNKNRCLACC